MQKTPKYIVIINSIKEQIESGALRDGEALPLENELCKTFSASHMTVTKALNELAVKGYLRRIPGNGTFVSQDYKTTIRKPVLQLGSITAMIEQSGMLPRTELLQYAVLKGKDVPETAGILKVQEEEFIHYFVRARYGNNHLVCLSYTYVSQSIMPTIDIVRLQKSFNEYIEELGIQRSSGYTEFCAALPSPEQTRLIGTAHVPLLKQTIMWNVNEVPFELTYHYYIGDKYTLTQDLQLHYNENSLLQSPPAHPVFSDEKSMS